MKRIISMILAILFLTTNSLAYTRTVKAKGFGIIVTSGVGNTITIEPKTQDIVGWEVEQGNIQVVNNQFTMPEEDVRINAIVNQAAANEYLLRVEFPYFINEENREAGEEITIQATTENEGYVFSRWIATGITLSEEQAVNSNLTFTMPENAVTLVANYEEATNYPMLAAQDTWYTQGNSGIDKSEITSISLMDSGMPSGTIAKSWDASATLDGSVTAYIIGEGAPVETDTVISEFNVGESVYLNVNGVSTEFIIVHQGNPNSTIYDASCDGTWLLMKNCYESRAYESGTEYDDASFYETSEINTYLSNTFITLFDSDIQNMIKTVKVPYTYGDAWYTEDTLKTGADGLPLKVFLLSGYEVGFTTTDYSRLPQEGTKLAYFESSSSSGGSTRVTSLNGTSSAWWLRSKLGIGTSSNVMAWQVQADGSGAYKSISMLSGIRPAIVLPSNIKVTSGTNKVLAEVASDSPVTEEVNYQLYIVGNGSNGINANIDSSSAFSGFASVESIENLDLLVTSQTANMSSMFEGFGNSNGGAEGYMFTNLISNGNFASGSSTGWSSQNSATLSVVDIASDATLQAAGSVNYGATKALKVTSGSSQYGQAVYQISGTNGHKYYFRASSVKPSNTKAAGVQLQLTESPYTAYGENNSTSAWNTWQEISCIADVASTANLFACLSTNRTDTTSGLLAYYTNVVLVDLTETYGAGNEPDKAWCDANLPYFDTTYNIASATPLTMDLSTWNMANVTNTTEMFNDCTTLKELTIPSSLKVISNNFASGCTALDTITFLHSASDIVTMPTAGSTTGAFYIPSYLETTINANNSTVTNYDWRTDNRALNTYVVTFNANGGSGSMNPQTFTEGVAQNLNTNVFTNEGYDFAGWSINSGSTTATYKDKQSYIATENIVCMLYGKNQKL